MEKYLKNIDKNKETIMFVDDEVMVLSALKRGIRKLPFNKIFVNDPREVMKIFEEIEIAVIVTDMKMPNLNGLELLKLVKASYPNTIKIVLSGYTQLPQVLAALNYGDIYKFITKPWNLEEEFIPTISEALEKYEFEKNSRIANRENQRKNKTYKKMLDASQLKESNFQSELMKIREFSSFLFYSLEEELKDVGKESIAVAYGDVCNAYTYSLPTINYIFSLEKLEKDINVDLKEIDCKFHISGIDEDMKSQKFKGNYRLLINVLELINEYTLECCNTKEFFVTTKIMDKGSVYTFIFMEKLNFKNDKSKKLMKILSKLINNLIRNMGGSFEILELENQNYYRLITNFMN